MIVLVYPKCTTCKKALAWLEEHSIPYEARHIVEQNPTEDEQYALLASDGMLVRRPLVIGENMVLCGFKQKEWEAAFHAE